MIPAEAVEAAWATMWDVPGVPTCNATRAEVRLALEAAAPHMLARAYNAGHLDGMNGAPNINPYSEQP